MDQSFFVESKDIFTLLHVIAVVIGLGGALISDILFTFFSHDRILNNRELRTLNNLSGIVWVSLVIIILSGIGIFFSHPEMYAQSAKFLSKMSIVALISINGYVLHRLVKPHLSRRSFLTSVHEMYARRTAFTCGAISLVSWLSALVLGLMKRVPYSYLEIMSLYVFVVIVSIIVARSVEWRKFSQHITLK